MDLKQGGGVIAIQLLLLSGDQVSQEMTSVFFVRGQWIEEDSSESRTWENHYPLLVGRADVIAVNDVINPSLIHHPAKSSPLAGVIEIVRVPQISLMIKDRDLPDPWNPQQLESPAGIHPPFLLKYELSPRISARTRGAGGSYSLFLTVILAHPCILQVKSALKRFFPTAQR